MVVLSSNLSSSLFSRVPSPPSSCSNCSRCFHFLPYLRISRTRVTVSSSSPSPFMDSQGRRFIDFPYVSEPHRQLMVELVTTVENRLEHHLLPCTLPPDVQYYENQTGTAHGSLNIRSANKSSPIDFILGSWLHCKLPSGELNITSLSAYLNPSTDAPHFLFELIRNSPTCLVVILDLTPRKDLVLYPDYLKTFYEDTQLDKQRELVHKIPKTQSYFSSSLYIRSVVSPTAILVRIEDKTGEHMEEIVRDELGPVAKEVLRVWLDQCACAKREVGESERALLKKRDSLIKIKTIEIDLGSNFPRLFGEEVAARVLGAMKEVFDT